MAKDLGTIFLRMAREDEAEAVDQFHKKNADKGVYHRKIEVIRSACSSGLYLLLVNKPPSGPESIIGTGATYVFPGAKYAEFGSMRVVDGFSGLKLAELEIMLQSINAFLYAPPKVKYFADVQDGLPANGIFTGINWQKFTPDQELVKAFEDSKDPSAPHNSNPPPVNYYELFASQLPAYASTILRLMDSPVIVSKERNGDQNSAKLDFSQLPFKKDLLQTLARQNFDPAVVKTTSWEEIRKKFSGSFGEYTPPITLAAANRNAILPNRRLGTHDFG